MAYNYEKIRAILDRIWFKPFDLIEYKFRLLKKGDGFLLQVEYLDVDVDAPRTPVSGGCHAGPAKVLQRGRKFYISPHMTETEIVETAWLACTRSMMHVAGEFFTYRNTRTQKPERIYSPHFRVEARQEIAQFFEFDKRPIPI